MLKLIGGRLYQWDLGRQMELHDPDGMQITEVNVCHPGDDEALVVIPERNGDTVTVDIPDVLMQSGEDLMVYECIGDVTVSRVRKSVIPRERPADYIYTETQVLTYKALEERIVKLEQGSVGIESIVQTTTSAEDGGTNIVTVTKTDGSTNTFQFKNGSKGNDGVISNYIKTTSTAEVGQILRVSAVDDNGKPTEFEPYSLKMGIRSTVESFWISFEEIPANTRKYLGEQYIFDPPPGAVYVAANTFQIARFPMLWFVPRLDLQTDGKYTVSVYVYNLGNEDVTLSEEELDIYPVYVGIVK